MLKTSFNKFFGQFLKTANKRSQILVTKVKYFLPDGSKTSPNGYKLSNLAALFLQFILTKISKLVECFMFIAFYEVFFWNKLLKGIQPY